MKMEQRECSEMSVHKVQTPRNHPKERIKNGNYFTIFNIGPRLKYLVSDNYNYNYECWMDGEDVKVKVTLKQEKKAQG
jgi:hypothetical protein